MFRYIFLIIILITSLPALAANPAACRRELGETYTAPDEASLNIALQNLGLCLELELYPKDVKEFLGREATCIHIAGEEPYSGERAAELERLNKTNNCDSATDEKEALLKKYRKDETITRALKEYGNKIYPPAENIESPADPEGNNPPSNMLQGAPDGGVI